MGPLSESFSAGVQMRYRAKNLLDPEDPTPGSVMGEDAAKNGAQDAPDGYDGPNDAS